MTNEIYESIVNKLTNLRISHQIGSEDMARYLGITRQSLYNFENLRHKSYSTMLSYLTHPAFDRDELNEIYKNLGGE